MVADLAVGKTAARAFALMMLINGIAPIMAPLVGAVLLVPFGWRSIFVFMGLFNVFAMIVLALVVKESLPPENRSAGGLRGLFGGIAEVVKIRGFLGYVIAFWFSFGAMFAYISGSPFVMQGQLGLGVGTYSMLFAVSSAMIVLGSAISARMVNTSIRAGCWPSHPLMLTASFFCLSRPPHPTVWVIVRC